MLSKNQRLRASEVREILSKGRSVRGTGVSAKVLPGRRAAAVVVSSKVAKSAVERNRIRRLAYRVLAGCLPEVRAAFFIVDKKFESAELVTLCSKLS